MDQQANNKSSTTAIGYIFREANIPEPIEKKSKKGWISIGKKNLHLQWLFSLYKNSSTHKGIINQKVQFNTQGGIEYEGTDIALFKEIEVNPDGTSVETVQAHSMLDFEVTESFAFLFKKDLSSEEENPKWFAYPIDVELLRPDENDLPQWHYSENWGANTQNTKSKYRIIPDIEAVDLVNGTECLFYYKSMAKQSILDNGQLTCNWFPDPIYSGSINDICTEIEISYFHYSETINGYKGGTLVNMNNGDPGEELRPIHEKKLKDSASNRNTQGGMIVAWNDGKERAATIEQLNGNNLDTRYLSTRETVVQSIMVGHSVINPVLWGVKTDNALGGGSDELMTAYLIYKTNHGLGRQSTVAGSMTYCLNLLNGLSGEIKYKDFTPSFQFQADEDPVLSRLNSMSPLLAGKSLDSMTVDEIRALNGLPPLPDGRGSRLSSEAATTGLPEPTANEVLHAFNQKGRSKKGLNFVATRGVDSYSKLEASEAEFIASLQTQKFAALTVLQGQILSSIAAGKKLPQIGREMSLSNTELLKEISLLESGGYLTLDKSSNPKLSPTGQAATSIKQKLRVVYSYETRPDAPALRPGGQSREFCRTLLRMDRVYTRAEIDAISRSIGRDVWTYRGGWYHNPQTDANQPSCRHYWQQHLILE